MDLLRAAKLAWRTVARNRLRSFLMMLGVLVGIASLTALDSVGESTKQETLRRFKRMIGTFDTVVVRPGANRSRGMPSLTNVEPSLKFEDARAIAAEVPEVSRVALVQNAFDIDVKSRDRTSSPAVFGVSANWTALRGEEIAAGAFFTDDDVAGLARVAVLGAEVAGTLFPGEDPIGKTVRIGDVPFQVKGVLRTLGAGPAGGSLDNLLFIPVTTASRRLFNRDFLTMAIAQLKDPSRSDAAMATIRALLRERHRLATAAQDRRRGHHEPHAHRGRRAAARDRRPPFGRRQPARHPAAVPARGAPRLGLRRADRDPRRARRHAGRHLAAKAAAGAPLGSPGLGGLPVGGTGPGLRRAPGLESLPGRSGGSPARLARAGPDRVP
jgi:hypothetical protein